MFAYSYHFIVYYFVMNYQVNSIVIKFGKFKNFKWIEKKTLNLRAIREYNSSILQA